MTKGHNSQNITVTDLTNMLSELSLNAKNEEFVSKSNMSRQKRVRKISFISHRCTIFNDETASANIENYLQKSKDKIVLSWNIKFDGSENMNAYKFIDLLSEKKKVFMISDKEMLNNISNLLQGDALKWYNMEKKFFYTWQDFVVNFTQAYKDPYHLSWLKKKHKTAYYHFSNNAATVIKAKNKRNNKKTPLTNSTQHNKI